MKGVSQPPPFCCYLKIYFERNTVLHYLSAPHCQCQTEKKKLKRKTGQETNPVFFASINAFPAMSAQG